MNTHVQTLIAVDIGNSRAKWGRFIDERLIDTVSLPLEGLTAFETQRALWSATGTDVSWSIASVNPAASKPLVDWLTACGARHLVLQDPAVLPLHVDLERPEAVGIDRLLDAVAANALRPADRSAILVDAGSAITVDAVSASGSFLGGAIAPGIGIGARALHEFTYWLPLLEVTEPPAALGKSTPDAMRSGLFWGSVGAVRELIARVESAVGSNPTVYVTGGNGRQFASHLARPVVFVPDLTLRGIWISTQHVFGRVG